jgi:hypothetical protein
MTSGTKDFVIFLLLKDEFFGPYIIWIYNGIFVEVNDFD